MYLPAVRSMGGVVSDVCQKESKLWFVSIPLQGTFSFADFDSLRIGQRAHQKEKSRTVFYSPAF